MGVRKPGLEPRFAMKCLFMMHTTASLFPLTEPYKGMQELALKYCDFESIILCYWERKVQSNSCHILQGHQKYRSKMKTLSIFIENVLTSFLYLLSTSSQALNWNQSLARGTGSRHKMPLSFHMSYFQLNQAFPATPKEQERSMQRSFSVTSVTCITGMNTGAEFVGRQRKYWFLNLITPR